MSGKSGRLPKNQRKISLQKVFMTIIPIRYSIIRKIFSLITEKQNGSLQKKANGLFIIALDTLPFLWELTGR